MHALPAISLTPELAETLAAVALKNVATVYPYHVVHLLHGDADVRPPRDLYPAFHGSYDWHSCVHMHWTLARCLRRFPSGSAAAAIATHFDARLTSPNIAGEIAYLGERGRASFERPYGWGWLLALHAELSALAALRADAARWCDALAPLAELIAARFVDLLPRLDYPVRAGTHNNTAFALALAHDYAQACRHAALRRAIEERARAWFVLDQRYPADYEPGGDDFLSGGLCEAVLMQRTLHGCGAGPVPGAGFANWWHAFAPAPDALAKWLTPVGVSDATDPKIVHLHGLNLSRAWCWRQLQPMLPSELQPAVERAIEAHLGASLAAATCGDYVGTHWLASFALLAVDAA